MTTETSALPGTRRALNPEWTLAVLAVLTFLLIPIQINTLYSGLPAHPLFLHVPVILIPLAVIGALVLAAWPRLFARHGIWVGAMTVVALGSTNLTMGAGEQLRRELGGEDASIIQQHADAAGKLRFAMILFTAVLLVAVAVYRTAGPRVSGVGFVDGALSAIRSRVALGAALRVLVVVLAILAGFFVFRTGDLGAKAVWQHRVGAGGQFPRGAFPGGKGAPPSGG
jgi:hypothetical protein